MDQSTHRLAPSDAAARRTPRRDRAALAGTLVVLAVLVALPFLISNFGVSTLTKVLIYALAILGLNLLTGINGQFSLGHGAFFAIGAYTTAILMVHGGVPYPLTLPVAALVTFTIGVAFGLPALRLENVYLALATFALAVATPQILKLSPLEAWTGGVQGLQYYAQKPKVPFGLPLSANQYMYFFVLAVCALVYWGTHNLVASRTGRAFMAIRDNPIAARSMGIDVSKYKATCFGISAMIAGLAGGLTAIYLPFVAPDSFTFTLSVGLFVGMVVGGVGWLPGAIFGGLFVVYAPNLAEEVATKGLAGAVYGVILILIIYLAPQGIGGLVRSIPIAARRVIRKGPARGQ
ncbi:branched-chain amino acid ABC transporter permease [Acuticoccus sp. I52.16.1]|uniref:branched-chain amino acid ABC transporter permease n=1 Tax=Acuticoccus sp. I52.16.1 TaxID=2928472 RepID=UPI001FD072B7|nr:branched-chain amino acid ABC transporter permease [Acuticoccus sp. I52.16.1]UOM33624.1 branched-chain amino acid ABC transporter permease [Acuticoccus sp. I52.16.1]